MLAYDGESDETLAPHPGSQRYPSLRPDPCIRPEDQPAPTITPYVVEGDPGRLTDSGNPWLSLDGRPKTHPAIASIDVSTMLNRPKASHWISSSKRFLDDPGYTSGYT